jgi:cholesterol 7-dehydrogenase
MGTIKYNRIIIDPIICQSISLSKKESHQFMNNTIPAFLLASTHSPILSMLLYAGIVFSVILNIYWLFSHYCSNNQQHTTKKKRRVDRSSTYPKQYANGWYRICNSIDVTVGQVKHVCYVGEELAVFRGEDGTVGVLDAFCPHLGANIAVDGKVVGNCIQCPFHLWEFNRDGQCTSIPYCDKVPTNAKTKSWVCVEKYNMIMVWYHNEGNEPDYSAISVPDLDKEGYAYRGSYAYANIHMHMQEFVENSADMQHFSPLHGTMTIPWTGPRSKIRAIPIPFIKIIHEASFALGEDPHVAYFYNTACLSIFNKKFPSTTVKATIQFYGPGSIALFRFDGEFGTIYLFHTHTPDSYTSLDVEFIVYAQTKIPRLLVWYIVGNWITQWQNDLSVWENKVHKKNPLLVKNDGPIMKMRRWYKQFYSTSLEW